MKKLRLFDSLKFVRAIFVAVATAFILNIAHADTTAIQSVIAYGKTEQNGTPTPTTPVPIMTNNGVLKYKSGKNLFDINDLNIGSVASDNVRYKSYAVPNGTYTMSTPDFPTVGSTANIFFFAGDVSSGASSASNGVLQGTSRTINVTNGYYTIGYRSGMTNPNNPKNYSWQIEQGSTATAYVPYSGPTGIYVDGLTETIRDSAGHTATAQMLLGIDDTYRDEQNITTGAITRRVGVKVLDGTENWYSATYSNGRIRFYTQFSEIFTINDGYSKISPMVSTHFIPSSGEKRADGSVFFYHDNMQKQVNFIPNGPSTVAQFKSWLAEQYANGTPVIVLYPLATETTESVATQSLTTAPVRQTLGAIMNMPIKTILTDNTEIMSGAEELIKIATTKYNEESFEDVQDALTGVFNAVDTVVTQTMTQAQQIDQIATNKQTRPDEGCTAKYCLLIEDEDGTPHWYPIAGANGVEYVLPSGYTQLEYIQSTGTQYIDTERVPNNNDIIEQKFQKVGDSTTTCSWYGSMPSSQLPRIGIGSFMGGGVPSIFVGINYTSTIRSADTNVHTLRFQATGEKELTYTLDGVTNVVALPGTANMYEPAIGLTSYLFARHGTNGVQVYDNEGTKIYYHREYLANGTLVLNMIPVKRNSDNVLGMYDLVSGQFFTNGGTGNFIAGPDM